MSIAKLATFLLAVALLRAHIANLPVTGASPVPLIIDFGFPAILLSDSSFTCGDSTGCKFIDQNDQQGTYRGSNYSFRHATLNLKIGANAYDLPVQINSNKLDVFGISLQTEYAAAFEGKAGLAIGLLGFAMFVGGMTVRMDQS